MNLLPGNPGGALEHDVPLVATNRPTTVKIVGLNFFPPSSDAQAGLWTASTDGALLMGNALAWAACIDNEGTAMAITVLRVGLRRQ